MDNLQLANDLQKLADRIDRDTLLMEDKINEDEGIMVAYHDLINVSLEIKFKIRKLRMGL